jgi:hypothetical protein
MDFDNISGGFIYVIIAAVIALFKHLNKKKTGGAYGTEKTKPKSLFDTLFGEIPPEPEQTEEQESISEEEYFQAAMEAESKVQPSVKEEVMNEKENNYFVMTESSGIEEFEDQSDDTNDFEFQNIDLRTAIIHSEIINRKYS